MSRGLGSLQREILAALDKAHEADFCSSDYRTVYDLLAVKETLAARGQGRLCQLWVPEIPEFLVWRSGAFEASFSRAIRTLVKRGVLRREWKRNNRGWIDTYHTAYVSRQPISVKSECALDGDLSGAISVK
jgi:predicted deacylase